MVFWPAMEAPRVLLGSMLLHQSRRDALIQLVAGPAADFLLNGRKAATSISVAAFLLGPGLGQLLGAARPASINEITELFDLAVARPNRSHFVADLSLSEPPATRAEIIAELEFQNDSLAKKVGTLTPPPLRDLSQNPELITARSNAIARAKSGLRTQHVEEFYSGKHSRLNITDEAFVMASAAKARMPSPSFHDSYVNIDDPQFSSYMSFAVNHELQSVAVTKAPERHYRMNDLWRAVSVDEPLELPLILALGDFNSIVTNQPPAAGDPGAAALLLSAIRIDSRKAMQLHDGSHPDWCLRATDTELDGLPVVLLKLEGRYPDPQTPLPLSTIVASYWLAAIGGRVVCIQGALTNITLHDSFFCNRSDFGTDGLPRLWTTSTIRSGVVKRWQARFQKLDLLPSFSDVEVFTPEFPASYIVAELTSGRSVILQQRGPGLASGSSRPAIRSSARAKRVLVLVIMGLVAVGPIWLACKIIRGWRCR